MPSPLPWRPISEASPDLEEAFVFDPNNAYLEAPCSGHERRMTDERMQWARRGDNGEWWVSFYQGDYSITPTHFLDPAVPEGYPALLDPAPFVAAENARAAAAQQEREAEAKLAAELGDGLTKHERAWKQTCEAYWAAQVKAAHGP